MASDTHRGGLGVGRVINACSVRSHRRMRRGRSLDIMRVMITGLELKTCMSLMSLVAWYIRHDGMH